MNPIDLFKTHHLFDLSLFQHKAIFSSIENVWEALDQMKSYLKNYELGVIRGTISPAAHIENPELISLGIGSVVEAGAYIRGPCIIGNYCTIRHGAYIREEVITGDHCVIGHSTEVKNSLFMNHAKAAHFSYIGNSILGNHVNLGAGVKLANLLFKTNEISIKIEGQTYPTKMKKLGAIIGDQAQIGCNSVTNPGTILGKESCVYPCMNFGGLLPENYVCKTSQETLSYPGNSHAFN